MGICGSKNETGAVELNKKNSKGLKSTMGANTKLTDQEAWAQVNKLWAEKKLKKEESMSFQAATPFIVDYIKKVKGVQKVDEGLVLSIFNEIDEDGNQSLDQKEMFEFIKKQEFKEPNAPATLQKKKTLTQTNTQAKTTKASDKKAASIYDAILKKVKETEGDLGAFPIKIPAKDKLQAFEEDEAVYEGERDQHK